MVQKILNFGRMIKFSHTVFALPFALASVVLAQRHNPVTLKLLLLILIAMACARSAAMGFNRLADAEIDAKNPRTTQRAIPAGILTKKTVTFFVAASSLLFILSALLLNRLCFYLSIPILVVLFSYSFTKRFTWLSHLYLGLAIGLAPIGAWIAVTGRFSASILPLSLALLTYIAGFDIIYACQDSAFDKKMGLLSIPSKWGIKNALRVSSVLHIVSFVLLCFVYPIFDMGAVYLVAVGVIGFLLILEHRLINPDDLSNIQVAFFNVNSIVSITLFLAVFLDEVVRRSL
ncbi:MAG: UbiA-like polyprenyltransferase, partial [Pseudomonadota bacterium]